MRKVLGDDLELYYEYPYPFSSRKKFDKKHIVTVGIGGNIGNVKRRFKKLFKILKTNRKISIISTSPLLRNPPFGYKDQPYFYIKFCMGLKGSERDPQCISVTPARGACTI